MLPAPMTVGQYVLPEGTPPPAEPVRAVARASGPVCSHAACTDAGVVQWSRRPTAEDVAELPPEQQATAATDVVIAVFACAAHAIHPDLAARVHAPECAGPAATVLPGCGCTTEPLPAPEPQAASQLPPGW